MGLLDSLTPDNYRNYVLPALGVAEAIATRGRSPGTTAMAQEQAIRQNQEDDIKKQQFAQQTAAAQQEAAARALQMRLGNFQLDEAQDKAKRDDQKNVILDAISKRAGNAIESRQTNSMAPNQETSQFQFGGEFKGQSPAAVQAIQIDPEKGLFETLANDQKAPLVQSEIYKNLHSADAATTKAAKEQDRSTIDPNAPKPLTIAQKNAETLRLRAQNITENKAYETQAQAFQKVMSAKDRGSISDVALMDNFVKANTNGTPTHEQYQATLGAVGLGQFVDKVVANQEGSYLSADKRKQIRDVMKDEFGQSHLRHKATNDDYRAQATSMQLNPNDVVHSSAYDKIVEDLLNPPAAATASPVGVAGWTQADEDRLNALSGTKK